VSLAIDFLGHAALRIELDGTSLLTDPAIRSRIGPLRRAAPEPSPDRLAGVGAVVISHLHWDHLDLPSLQRLPAGVPIVVPTGAGAWLRAQGFPDVRELSAGGSLTVGAVRIEAVQAAHSGFRPPRGPTAPALGYLLSGRHRTVFFAGDTDLFDEMTTIGRAHDLDVALIPVWGWGPTLGRGRHLDPVSAATAVARLRPRLAVPIHWGTYWPHALGRVRPALLVEPPAAFAEAVADAAPAVRVRVTEVGSAVDLTGLPDEPGAE